MGRTRKRFSNIITDRVVKMLIALGYSEKAMTVWDLAKELDVTYSYLYQQLLPKMKALGCVEDYKDTKHRRIRLTVKGLEIFKRFAEIGELLGEPVAVSGDRRLDLIISARSDLI